MNNTFGRSLKIYLTLFLAGMGFFLYFYLQNPVSVKAQAPLTISYRQVYTASAKSNSNITVKTVVPPQCSPDSLYAQPGPISAAGNQLGLIEVADAPYSHKMYGRSAEQLKALGLKCPLVVPGDSQVYINSYTSYWIGWQFSSTLGEDGLCSVSNAKVLLHTSQALPDWQNASGASPALAAAWQAYLSSVKIHENGLLQLDENYANRMLSQLQNFQPTSCGSIVQSVNSMGNGLLASLHQASQAYENTTDYGALQGAIIP